LLSEITPKEEKHAKGLRNKKEEIGIPQLALSG